MSTSKTRRKINWPAIAAAPVGGIAMCVASVLSDRVWLGVACLAITFGFAAVLAIVSRFSDTGALLADDVHEERNVDIHQRAALYTLNILAVFIIGGGVYELARGGDGGPYVFLAFVAGVTYVVCLLVLNRRS
ncbi:hypothetical protein [Flindersiella endophytica]